MSEPHEPDRASIVDQPSIIGRPEDRYPGRRQSDELTADELVATPAWWFPPPDGHLTGPDACTVLPIDASGAADDGAVDFPEGKYLLRAVFTLADGTEMEGHVTYAAGEPSTIETQEPAVATPRGQALLWRGAMVPGAQDIARTLALFEKSRDAVFPIRWRALLHPPGAEIAGSADGFAVWRNGGVQFV